ncbi:MAG: phosphoenolpyruvate--protein phosphotransferase, partial [Eubacteriaceae bacterium]|nr:phosphoenolpyruvate--protein phosphotransferase [Eubacteriaceae bacterium]
MKGIGASPGIAIAKAFVLKHQEVVINTSLVEDSQQELKRLKDAVDNSRTQLQSIYKKAVVELGEEEAMIFSAHMMILDDPEFVGQIEETVKSQKISADNGIKQITDQFVMIFDSMDDEYMKERAADIKDVGGRILRNALGIKEQDLSLISEDSIVIAVDLTPSDTAQMNKDKVLGFATDIGGRTSHTAIMARSLEIPAVLGLSTITALVKDEDLIIVDGMDGVVIINPDEKTKQEYLDK